MFLSTPLVTPQVLPYVSGTRGGRNARNRDATHPHTRTISQSNQPKQPLQHTNTAKTLAILPGPPYAELSIERRLYKGLASPCLRQLRQRQRQCNRRFCTPLRDSPLYRVSLAIGRRRLGRRNRTCCIPATPARFRKSHPPLRRIVSRAQKQGSVAESEAVDPRRPLDEIQSQLAGAFNVS